MFLTYILALYFLRLAAAGCEDKDSCYKDLEAYCRVAYPIEPISITQTESAFVTTTTTTTETETFVGIKEGRVRGSASLVPFRTTQTAFAAQVTPASKQMRENAMIKNLCSCIQTPTTTTVATETTSFTSTVTETATTLEVYCRKGCRKHYEYCDTSAPPTDDPDKRPAGVCRPAGECDVNSDCTTKKGKKKCRCILDENEESSPGYCISYSALDCDDLDDAQACENSTVCPEDYVCLDACPNDSDTKFCVKPRTYRSFCEVADSPDAIFGQQKRPQWPFHRGL